MKRFTILFAASLLLFACAKKAPVVDPDDVEDEVTVPEGSVDLGIVLSRPDGTTYHVFWAECNVGASKPEEYGDFFAWGETATKSSFTPANYKWKSGYPNAELAAEDDAAYVNMGPQWRTPSKEQMNALRTECRWEKGSLNGVAGYYVVGKNDNKIFLPFAGYMYRSENQGVVTSGNWWSRSRNSEEGSNIYYMGIDYLHSLTEYTNHTSPQIGCSVRAVYNNE
jgi:hypothetical protein